MHTWVLAKMDKLFTQLNVAQCTVAELREWTNCTIHVGPIKDGQTQKHKREVETLYPNVTLK